MAQFLVRSDASLIPLNELPLKLFYKEKQ